MTNEREFQGAHSELTERILGIFYKVANDLGYGFFESVYRRSLLIAFHDAGIAAEEEVQIPVTYRGRLVGNFYADIVVAGLVVLELKAADEITKLFEAQLVHYLRSSQMEAGIILAFGERAKFRRVYMSNDRKPNLKHSP
jgi:GxxExxY protein